MLMSGRNIFDILGKDWASAHVLTCYGHPQNCHVIRGSDFEYTNESIMS